MKRANYFSVCAGDLKKGLVLPPEYYNLKPSLDEVRAFTATKFSFDLEWNEMGEPTICGLTDKYYHSIVVPWEPPLRNGEFLPLEDRFQIEGANRGSLSHAALLRIIPVLRINPEQGYPSPWPLALRPR